MLQGIRPADAAVFTNTWCILNLGTARWRGDSRSANSIRVTKAKATFLQPDTVPWEGKAGGGGGWLGPLYPRVSNFCCRQYSHAAHVNWKPAGTQISEPIHNPTSARGLPQKPYYTEAQTTGGFVELQDYPLNLLKEWNRTATEGSYRGRSQSSSAEMWL